MRSVLHSTGDRLIYFASPTKLLYIQIQQIMYSENIEFHITIQITYYFGVRNRIMIYTYETGVMFEYSFKGLAKDV